MTHDRRGFATSMPSGSAESSQRRPETRGGAPDIRVADAPARTSRTEIAEVIRIGANPLVQVTYSVGRRRVVRPGHLNRRTLIGRGRTLDDAPVRGTNCDKVATACSTSLKYCIGLCLMTMTESPILEIPPFANANVPADTLKLDLTAALEIGKVVSIPGMNFALSGDELKLLDPRILAKAKNVSYSPSTGKIGGTSCTGAEAEVLTAMIARYSKLAGELIGALFPPYKGKFQLLRTSLRPAEIAGRRSSWRKDDTRLHVDAFPSQPTNGNRILRVFCNVNPVGKPRVWRLGEPFEDVAKRFLPGIGRPFPGS